MTAEGFVSVSAAKVPAVFAQHSIRGGPESHPW